jgi:glucose-6-phosphate isomerase
MLSFVNTQKSTFSYRIILSVITFTFIFSMLAPPAVMAQQILAPSVHNLPPVGTMVNPTPQFIPAFIKGVTVDPVNPLRFDFIVDTGDSNIKGETLKQESQKMIKYFLAALTTPDNELWVNLSPYEKEQIMPDGFANTELGMDLLAEDYLLKQLTASLMHPEQQLGSEFWKRVNTKAKQIYGTTEIPLNTFNKIWIVPEKAVVYQTGTSAYVIESHLKVMLEKDYLTMSKNLKNGQLGTEKMGAQDVDKINGVSSEVVREVLIPEIEHEVNQGKTFANLRQIYNSVILANWYKENLKETLLSQVYVNQNKSKGVDTSDKELKSKIYNQYVAAFQKGVYNYIKEDYDPAEQKKTYRKYFSGGIGLNLAKTNLGVTGSIVEVVNSDVLRSSPAREQEVAKSLTVSSPAADLYGMGVNLVEFNDKNASAIASGEVSPSSPVGQLATLRKEQEGLNLNSYFAAVNLMEKYDDQKRAVQETASRSITAQTTEAQKRQISEGLTTRLAEIEAEYQREDAALKASTERQRMELEQAIAALEKPTSSPARVLTFAQFKAELEANQAKIDPSTKVWLNGERLDVSNPRSYSFVERVANALGVRFRESLPRQTFTVTITSTSSGDSLNISTLGLPPVSSPAGEPRDRVLERLRFFIPEMERIGEVKVWINDLRIQGIQGQLGKAVETVMKANYRAGENFFLEINHPDSRTTEVKIHGPVSSPVTVVTEQMVVVNSETFIPQAVEGALNEIIKSLEQQQQLGRRDISFQGWDDLAYAIMEAASESFDVRDRVDLRNRKDSRYYWQVPEDQVAELIKWLRRQLSITQGKIISETTNDAVETTERRWVYVKDIRYDPDDVKTALNEIISSLKIQERMRLSEISSFEVRGDLAWDLMGAVPEIFRVVNLVEMGSLEWHVPRDKVAGLLEWFRGQLSLVEREAPSSSVNDFEESFKGVINDEKEKLTQKTISIRTVTPLAFQERGVEIINQAIDASNRAKNHSRGEDELLGSLSELQQVRIRLDGFMTEASNALEKSTGIESKQVMTFIGEVWGIFTSLLTVETAINNQLTILEMKRRGKIASSPATALAEAESKIQQEAAQVIPRVNREIEELVGLTQEEALKRYPENSFAKNGFDPANRLGWAPKRLKEILDNPTMLNPTFEVAENLRDNYKYIIFSGMGGSGLSMQVVKTTFDTGKGEQMYSLRTTDAGVIAEMIDGIIASEGGDVVKALRLIAFVSTTKSFTTAETLSHQEYIEGLYKKFNVKPAPGQFTIYTDPTDDAGKLKKQAAAREYGYDIRLIQPNAGTDVGGRFTTPTTNVFLLPLAVLKSRDEVMAILRRAYEMNNVSNPEQDIFGRLGVYLDHMDRQLGKNKLTVFVPEALRDLPGWSEQLLEESLGKDGKGVSVIYGERLGLDQLKPAAESDRVFLRVNLGGVKTNAEFIDQVKAAGHPVFDIDLTSVDDAGGLMLGLQRAVAVYASLQGINFTTQPGVEGYKKGTQVVLKALAPGEKVKAPDMAHSDFRSLKVYYAPLIKAGITTEEEIAQEVQRLGSTMQDGAAVYAALINISLRKAQQDPVRFGKFELSEIATYGRMNEEFRAVMEEARFNIFTDGLKMASKLGEGPDKNHSYQQMVAQGKNYHFSTYLKANKTPQSRYAEYDTNVNDAIPQGTTSSLTDVNRKVVLITMEGTVADSVADVRAFFEKVATMTEKYQPASSPAFSEEYIRGRLDTALQQLASARETNPELSAVIQSAQESLKSLLKNPAQPQAITTAIAALQTARQQLEQLFNLETTEEELAGQIQRFDLILRGARSAIEDWQSLRTSTSSPAVETAERGGIDFSSPLLKLQIKRDDNGVPLPLPQQPANLNGQIEGFIPVIINVTPIPNLPQLLGLNTPPVTDEDEYSFNGGYPDLLGRDEYAEEVGKLALKEE